MNAFNRFCIDSKGVQWYSRCMTKRKKTKQSSKFEMTEENLKTLDQSTLVDLLLRLHEQNKKLSEMLQSMVREKHGPKTERFENTDQLSIFDKEKEPTQIEVSQENADSQPLKREEKTQKKKSGHTRNPMPCHLERKPITGKPTQEELTCFCCSTQRVKINEFVRNSRFEYQPASLFVEDFIETILECPKCGDTVTVKPATVQSIENGTAGPGLQAEIVIAKYEDHLPLHRQEQRFARIGAPIARSTMVGWLWKTATTLRPVYDRMKKLLLQSKVIATDDTPVKVQDRTKSKNIKLGRKWIYRGDESHPVNVFDYTQGRGRAGPQVFLSGFNGYLQGDCFSGNIALCVATGATLVACWAHARRYFIKALPNNKATCEEILKMFSELFEIERTARELALSAQEIKLMREQESKPLLDKIKKWLDTQVIIALPQSSFGKAVKYSLNNWNELTNFLLDGDLKIDNNLAEQEMKRIAIGRKNWLFFGSDNGGEQAEVLMSITSTCKRHGVNPFEYLKDVIQKLSENPDCNLDSLLPFNWKPQEALSELDSCHSTPKVAF